MNILSAFGVSAAAGLNAYLPLLIVGLLARYTDLITLNSPWNALENPWVLGLLVVLLIIEMTVDKIAIADSVNDVLQTVVRPAAGAILFASSGNLISNMSPVLAMGLGIVAAGSIHAVKATARPVVTATTGGLGNPVISVVEDVISVALTLLAILVPIITAILLLVAVWLVLRWVRRRRAASQATGITPMEANSDVVLGDELG